MVSMGATVPHSTYSWSTEFMSNTKEDYLLRSRFTKALAASEMSCQALLVKVGSCVRIACLQVIYTVSRQMLLILRQTVVMSLSTHFVLSAGCHQ